MKILLLVPTPPRTCWPKGLYRNWSFDTGLACAATTLRREGHDVRIVRREEQLIKLGFDWDRAEADLRNLIQTFRPALVVQSVATPAMSEAARIARRIKEIAGTHTINVLCGTHPSGVPELALSESADVDAVVVGEFEATLRDVADTGPLPEVPGLVVRQDGRFIHTPHRAAVPELDAIGPPAYDLLDMEFQKRRNPWMIRYLNLSCLNIRTSRGCPNRCVFCAEHLIGGLGVRFHSLDYVMEQVGYACAQGFEAVHFEDETFAADRDRLLAICEAMQRWGFHKKIKWDCLMRVDQVQPELLAAMKAAGCIQIEYGFESGSDKALRSVGKNATVEQNRRAVSLTRQAGIRVFADIMVGLPGETGEDLDATVRFLRWAKPEILSAGRLLPMPGTVLYSRLPAHVRSSLSWEGYSYTPQPGFQLNLTDMPDAQFERWYRDFFKYTVKPHNTLALLRDVGLTDDKARREYRRALCRFAWHHPLRVLRLPIRLGSRNRWFQEQSLRRCADPRLG
ncbi:MAG TPA: radical SAM protein [Sedimentisphaerales bacterium]|nr:radical SAM protein [Sedimentisphaerales bacterium]